MPGLIGVKVLAAAWYARQERHAVRCGIIAMIVNLALNLILVFPLQHVGLALATSLAAWTQAALLYVGLKRQGIYRPAPGWGPLLARIATACLLMACVLGWYIPEEERWLEQAAWERALHLGATVCGGMALYLGGLWLCGFGRR